MTVFYRELSFTSGCEHKSTYFVAMSPLTPHHLSQTAQYLLLLMRASLRDQLVRVDRQSSGPVGRVGKDLVEVEFLLALTRAIVRSLSIPLQKAVLYIPGAEWMFCVPIAVSRSLARNSVNTTVRKL